MFLLELSDSEDSKVAERPVVWIQRLNIQIFISHFCKHTAVTSLVAITAPNGLAKQAEPSPTENNMDSKTTILPGASDEKLSIGEVPRSAFNPGGSLLKTKRDPINRLDCSATAIKKSKQAPVFSESQESRSTPRSPANQSLFGNTNYLPYHGTTLFQHPTTSNFLISQLLPLYHSH